MRMFGAPTVLASAEERTRTPRALVAQGTLVPLVALVALVAALVAIVVNSAAAHADQLRVASPTTALGSTDIGGANTTTHGSAVLTVGGVQHAYFVAQPSQGGSGPQPSLLVNVTPGGATSKTSLTSPGFDVASEAIATSPSLFVTAGPSAANPSVAVLRVGTDGKPASTMSALDFASALPSSGYVATFVAVDPVRHRGYVSLSSSGRETYIGEFATGAGSTPISVLGVVDAKTTSQVRLGVDQPTGAVYFSELGGTAVRRLRTDGTVEAMSCLSLGSGQLGAIAVAGGSIYVADLAYAQLWRISDIASASGCTATAIAVSASLPYGADDVAVAPIITGNTTSYRVFAASVLPCGSVTTSGEGCVATIDPVTQTMTTAAVGFSVQSLLPVTTAGAQVGTVLAIGQKSTMDVDVATVSTGGSAGVATLTPSTLPTGNVGSAYIAVLSTTGGTSSPQLNAAWAGAAPQGLTITATFEGVRVGGTPTAAGTYRLSVAWAGGTTDLPLSIGNPACSATNVSASRPGTAYPKYTATTSDECSPWGLAALAGGTTGLSGYRSAQHSQLVPQQVNVDLGMTTRITSITLTPASGYSTAFPAGATVRASTSAGCLSGAGTVTVTASLQAGAQLIPPAGTYRYVCLAVSSMPAGGPVTEDPASGYYFALGAFTLTTCQCATFSPSALPHARVGNRYQQTVTFSSGSLNTSPTSTTLSASPALASGLSIASGTTSATIVGTPSAAGTYALTAKGVAGGQSSTATYPLVIDQQVAFLDAVSGNLTLPSTPVCQQTLGCPYDAALRLTGGGGLRVDVVAGSTLPGGLQVSKASDGTWHVSGRLSAQVPVGDKTFSLRATDDDSVALPVGGSQNVTLRLPVTAAAVSFAPAGLPAAHVGTPYGASVVPSGAASSIYLNHNPMTKTLTAYGLTVSVLAVTPSQSQVTVTGTPSADLLGGALTFSVCAATAPETCRDYAVTAAVTATGTGGGDGGTGTGGTGGTGGSGGSGGSGGTGSGGGGGGTGGQPCDKTNAVVESSDGSATLTASSTHDCDGFDEASLLFADDDPVPGDGAWGTLVRPARLRGFLTTPASAQSVQTVTLDLGATRPVQTVHLTPVLGALPANPSVMVSATSPTCAGGSSWQAALGYQVPTSGIDGIFGWDFVDTSAAQTIRFVCVSATTVQLGSAFGALQGSYAFGLQFIRTQSEWMAMTRGPDDAVPHRTALLQITGSHDNVVQFAGSGWAGLTPTTYLTCKATIDCSATLPDATAIRISATVDRSGVLSATITLPPGTFWARDDPWATLAVIGTRATGAPTTRVAAVASVAIADSPPSYNQGLMPYGFGSAQTLDVCGMASTTSVSWTAFDAGGKQLGQPQSVGWSYQPGAGDPINHWGCYSAQVPWPQSAAYERITETTPGKPLLTLWWRGTDFTTSLTSPFATAS